MKPYAKLLALTLLVILLAACGGKTEPTPTKTPRPTATPTPLPPLAALLPAVASTRAQTPRTTGTPPETMRMTQPSHSRGIVVVSLGTATDLFTHRGVRLDIAQTVIIHHP